MENYGHGTVEVGKDPVLICAPWSPKSQAWLIRNTGDKMVYIGGETVTADHESTGGMPIEPGQWLPVSAYLQPRSLYGVVADGKSYVSWLSPHC